MIIGNGMLARAFAPRYAGDRDVLVFASGVCDSRESRCEAFQRERTLLEPFVASTDLRLVYFSCCELSVARPARTPYMQHKQAMESLVLSRPGSLVLRLPQVVGVSPNTFTLGNFIRDRLLSGERFTVWSNAERSLVDIDHVVAIGSKLIDGAGSDGTVIQLAVTDALRMIDIVGIFEKVMQRKANFTIELRGEPLRIDAPEAIGIASRLGIELGAGYTERVVRKYYSASPVVPEHKAS